MTIRLNILPAAKLDVINIGYRYRMLSGANSARNITDKLRENIELLKSNPYLGRICDEPPFSDKDYRRLICGNYLCIYKVFDDHVTVYRVLDGRTDYPKLFETE